MYCSSQRISHGKGNLSLVAITMEMRADQNFDCDVFYDLLMPKSETDYGVMV